MASLVKAAAFRRLCVETPQYPAQCKLQFQAAAFRRLCVETYTAFAIYLQGFRSRLQAAVC